MSPKNTQPKYVTIATRVEHDVREQLTRLAQQLSAEKGARIDRMDALNIAVREALAARGVQP